MRSALRDSCLCAGTLPTVIETMSGTSGEGDSPPLMPLQWLPINLAVTFTLEFICISAKLGFRPASRFQLKRLCYKVQRLPPAVGAFISNQISVDCLLATMLGEASLLARNYHRRHNLGQHDRY